MILISWWAMPILRVRAIKFFGLVALYCLYDRRRRAGPHRAGGNARPTPGPSCKPYHPGWSRRIPLRWFWVYRIVQRLIFSLGSIHSPSLNQIWTVHPFWPHSRLFLSVFGPQFIGRRHRLVVRQRCIGIHFFILAFHHDIFIKLARCRHRSSFAAFPGLAVDF